MKNTTCKYFSNRSIFYASVIFLWCIFGSITNGIAQKLELGLGTGTMLYKGEVSYYFNPANFSTYVSAFGRYNFSHTVVLKIDGGIGNVKASQYQSDDIYIRSFDPNETVTFQTQIWEASVGLEYNFLDYRKYKSHTRGTPYLTGGFGIFTFDTPTRYEGQDKPGMEFSIPFGIGYKYVLSRHWNLGAEFGARKTFTGYLDGINNTRYYNYDGHGIQPQRGYKDWQDWYCAAKITLSYTFYRIDCPFEVPTHIK
jgi:Domain of unknown function (DUF6089)